MAIKQPSEAAVLKACLQYLAALNIFSWRSNNTGVRRTDKVGRAFWSFTGMAGVADILAVLDRVGDRGRLMAIECKSSTGKVSPAQQHFLDTVNRLGGIGLVVRSVDDLASALRDLGYGR